MATRGAWIPPEQTDRPSGCLPQRSRAREEGHQPPASGHVDSVGRRQPPRRPVPNSASRGQP
eukprot:80479-Alexandrium_andersonii.AAC.1